MYYNEEISEIDTHITLPIVNQMVFKFIEEFGLTNIFENEVYITSTSMASSSSTNPNTNRPKLKNNKLECRYRPILNPTALKWDNNKSKDYIGHNLYNRQESRIYPIFKDEVSNVTLREHGTPCNLMLEYKLSFINKTDAETTLSKMYNKLQGWGMMLPCNNLIYDYKFPQTSLGILFLLYKLSKRNLNKFLEYLKENSKNNISFNRNRDPDSDLVEMIIQKNMADALASMDLSQEEPEVETNAKSPDLFTLNFTVTFQFLRPNMNTLIYPVVVYNEYVPGIAIPVLKDSNLKKIEATYPDISFNAYFKRYQAGSTLAPVRIPWYDDWEISPANIMLWRKYKPFLISVFTLDELTTKIDLTKPIGGVQLKEEVLHELSTQGNSSLYTEGKYNISVYVNGDLLEPEDLRLENGTFLTVFNSDITKQYHLVLFEKIYPTYEAPTRLWILEANIRVHTNRD